MRELLRAGRRHVRGIFVLATAKPAPELHEILALARQAGIAVIRVDRPRLDSLAGEGNRQAVNHQGIVAEVDPPRYTPLADMPARPGADPPPLYLLADGIQDPQNLGSMLRSAEAAGVTGVILSAERSVAVTPAVVRASAGASEHLRIGLAPNLVPVIQALAQDGVAVFALDNTDAHAGAVGARDAIGGAAVVVGGEGRGLRPGVRKACQASLCIPMRGQIGSLNAAVAAAIALFDLRRRQLSS